MFSILQALLGFQPDAPNNILYVDPALPGWLPELTVRDLKLGKACFDIRFFKDPTHTRFEVLAGPKDQVRLRAMCGS
jgi:hypothetical protein